MRVGVSLSVAVRVRAKIRAPEYLGLAVTFRAHGIVVLGLAVRAGHNKIWPQVKG